MRARPEAVHTVAAERAPVATGTTPEARVAGPPARHGGRLTTLDKLMGSGPARRFFSYPLVDRCLAPARGMGSFAKFLRYSMVSAVAIVISQVVILIAAWLFHLSGIASNALGAAASTPASFELNRKWAWGKTGKSHLWREVVPFWALTLTGLAASTGTVQIADSMAKSHHVLGLDRALLIMGASLFAWGVVWVAKFVIFNRLVFAPRGGEGPERRWGRQEAGHPTGASGAGGPRWEPGTEPRVEAPAASGGPVGAASGHVVPKA